MLAIEDQLKEIAQSLDISPTDFIRARTRYRGLKQWLLDGAYTSGASATVYLQGSFRLGTVVRPYYADKDGDFDIDQVCEISEPVSSLSPGSLKQDVGRRLKAHGTYSRMLDDEGRRCWTMIYASEDSRPGFHLDVLPAAKSSPAIGTQIDITNKDKTRGTYSWLTSNPNGYYRWFKSKNALSDELVNRQRAQIFESYPELFEGKEDVPKRLIRSSLQRSIQLMKRHRDVHFSGKNNKPISIILTTIAAHLYSGEGIDGTVSEFVDYASRRHEDLLKYGTIPYDGILDYIDGQWWVSNPVHEEFELKDRENFADKWNEDPACSAAFFEWVRAMKRAFKRFRQSEFSNDLNLKLPSGGDGVPYTALLKDRISNSLNNRTLDAHDLLDLIHLGIEGNVPWKDVRDTAERYFQVSSNAGSEDVYKVNFYQVTRHRNIDFLPEARRDIENLIQRHSGDAAYVLCGNLLLGTATKQMLKACLKSSYEDVLSWPILRLADPELLLP